MGWKSDFYPKIYTKNFKILTFFNLIDFQIVTKEFLEIVNFYFSKT